MATFIGNTESSHIDGMSAAKVVAVGDALQKEIQFIKEMVAEEDAISVLKAVNGMGTDEDLLIDIVCNRTKGQLALTSAAMVTRCGKTLLQKVESDISGSFGTLVGYSLMKIDDYGATLFTDCTKGMGTNEAGLIDLVNTRTNAELAAIKTKWDAKNHGSVIDVLNAEFGILSKHIKTILIKQFQGEKSESTTVDQALAKEQAQKLYKAGVGRMGTDEAVFIDILVGSSRAQIQAIKAEYERAQNQSLKKAIEKETSGHFQKALVALLEPSVESYTALALHQACDGVGANKDRLCRILGGTDKSLMGEVAARHLDVFGRQLQDLFKSETVIMGDFLKACIAWVQHADPTGGLEYLPMPSDPRAKAKLLLDTRNNMLTFLHTYDARTIRLACKGMGTDNDTLIRVLCSRNKAHLQEVDRTYHTLFGKSLVQEIKSETSGNYEDMLVALVLPYDEVDCLLMKKACDGAGTDEQAVIGLLAPHSNARILAMKKKYDAKNSRPLIDRLNGELSGCLKKLVHLLLRAERDEGAPADEALAIQQAQQLHAAGVAQWGTQESVFMDILYKASRPQIEAIKQQYEKLFNHSLRRAIEKETSGDLEMALLALIHTPIEYNAQQLKKAFKGMGTDERTVVRIIGGHDKNELAEISAYYLDTYGKTLAEELKSELSGNFRTAAISWVQNPDPLNLESLKEALQGL